MAGIYSRWGKEISSEEKWEKFKNRLQILLQSDVSTNKSEVELVAFRLGRPVSEVSHASVWEIDIESLIDNAETPFEISKVIEALVDCVDSIGDMAETIANVVNNAGCGISMRHNKEGWLTYPAGEKILDEHLVDRPLSFLPAQPLKEYSRALDHYSTKKWEECAEKVRRSLEEYLRCKLNTSKGLQASIPELGKVLKVSNGVPSHLVSTIISILKILDKNFNESSKHQSKTYDEKECEFLIYQSGLLMVLLNKMEIRKGES